MRDLLNRLSSLSPAKRDLLLLKLKKTIGTPTWLDSIAAQLPAMTVADMEAEAKLDPAIDPQSAVSVSTGEPASILLTGATGFLGAFLLHELLRQTNAAIYCLVRASSPDHGRQRILDNLNSYLLRSEYPSGRIVPVLGDLSLPRMGLTPRVFDQLAEQVDLIFHCGAVVKWTYPYRALKNANVRGTHEVVRLACHFRLKPLHFISTVGAFSSPDRAGDVIFESEDLRSAGTLYVGYAQSKWVAERLLTLAKSRGLPACIFRPNIGAHSQTGVFNRHDHVSIMIKGCVQLSSAPELDNRVSGAPVDYVSEAIVYLSRQKAALGKTFHLVNPCDINWNDLCDWMRSYGYVMRQLPIPEWRSELTKAIRDSKENALRAFLPFFTESMLKKTHLPQFDCRNTDAGLSGSGITCPPIDSQLLENYFSYLIRSGNLQPPENAVQGAPR
jgi:thioester reductase-like protein